MKRVEICFARSDVACVDVVLEQGWWLRLRGIGVDTVVFKLVVEHLKWGWTSAVDGGAPHRPHPELTKQHADTHVASQEE